jgi:hypothetical protein
LAAERGVSATLSGPAQPRARTPRSVRAGPCAETLAAIRERGVALAIWRRTLAPALAAAVAGWAGERRRLTLRPDDAAAFTSGLPPPLAVDIAQLVRRYAEIGGWREVEARLDVSSGVPCPRFHVDRVQSRLLCTYRGRGTQWLAAPGDPAASAVDAGIEELSAGDVAILKGSIHADGTPGMPHRSPPWTAEDGPRVLLVIDGLN